MVQTLLEVVNPNGNIQAVVESDGHVCYFYLFSKPETGFGTKSVWVRNHVGAPKLLDPDRPKAGLPPINPASHCRQAQGLPIPCQESLRVVWLPEGNGAALYEDSELLAIIPPWGGTGGFHGYAREAVGDGPLAWALTDTNVLITRFAEAESYWHRWEEHDLWQNTQSSLMEYAEKCLGKHSNYYAIDGMQWPPKALIRIPRGNSVVLLTIGVSLRPQPSVEMSTETPELFRRIELGAVLPLAWSDDAIKQFASYLSGQSNYPWNRYSWLGPQHTMPCDAWQNRRYTFALLSREHPGVPELDLGTLFNDPVKALWFIPLTAQERERAVEHRTEFIGQQISSARWLDA